MTATASFGSTVAAVVLLAGCDLALGLSRPGPDASTIDAAPRCPNNYVGNGAGFYRYSTAERSWAEAQADCRADATRSVISGHTHLVVLASDAELQALMPTAETWIGLTDLESEGQFRWLTAEDALIAPRFPAQPMQPPWFPTEPNNINGEHCALIQGASRTLYDYNCADQHRFICECDDFASP